MRRLQKHPAFQHLNWHPSARDLRRFSVAMLAGFGLLGVLVALRTGQPTVFSLCLWSAGLVLAACGAIPALARPAWLTVYIPSMLAGYVVSKVLLTCLFFLLFLPIGAMLRIAGHDPLQRRDGETVWRDASAAPEKSYYRQF